MQQDLNDLYYFVQVVDNQGFAAASRTLGIPKSKLSRRISTLEERLGVRLIHRSTRHFTVTEIGESYYGHCKAMLVEADAAQQAIDLTRSEPQGTVRVSCPVALLHARVGEMLADFMAARPKITVHLDATNRRVDVIGERVDVAIRVRVPPLEDSGLVMKVLTERAWCMVASPRLVPDGAAPKTPADLADLPTLDIGPAQPSHVWKLEGPNGATAEVRHVPRLVTDDMLTLRQAAIAGAGIVPLPSMLVSDQLRQGQLVRLVPAWQPRGGIIHAVYPTRRGLLPSVRALIDYLAARFSKLDET